MGGVVGRLMSEFAVTLSAAVAVSIFLSLTLTPMLCGQFLKRPEPLSNPILKAIDRGFRTIEESYARALDVVLRHMRLALAVFIVTAGLAIVLYIITPTGFFPQQDTGIIRGVVVTSQDASFAKTGAEDRAWSGRCSNRIRTSSSAGFFVGGSGANQANVIISLKPRDDGRTASSDEIIDPAAAQARETGGRADLPAVVPGHQRGRPRRPGAVPVHAGRCRTWTS